ncbi:MAG: hypothetical protein RL033_3502 [Pseudomonadota bacterium]|jgi:vacuolar-type H+-ATPase subunit E/Vma4
MSLSNERGRPKSLRFVDVSSEVISPGPGWLQRRAEESARVQSTERVDRLMPPEMPTHERLPLSPLMESVRPPPPPRNSQYPSMLPGPPSQYPAAPEMPHVEPVTLGAAPEPRFDTQVEDLVPRAEEEAVAAIATAIDRFHRERQQSLLAAERELVDLVQAVCRRVLLVETTQNPLLAQRLVHAGLEALAGGDKVTVRVGPFFADAAQAIQDSLEHRGVRSVVLVDASVGPQGLQLSTELGRVDESVMKRLDVLLANLGLADAAVPME